MIDLGLLNETVDVVSGHELSQLGITLGAIAFALAVLWQVPSALVWDVVDRGPSESSKFYKVNPHRTRDHPNSVAPVIVLVILGTLAATLGAPVVFTVVVITLLSVMTVIAFAYHHFESHGRVEKWVTLAILVVSSALLAGMNLVPKDEIYEPAPSDAAMSESASAMSTIKQAILDDYDAEIVPGNSCFVNSKKTYKGAPREQHNDRVSFIEKAVSGNPDEAPGIRIITNEGVAGCYSLLYDNSTGEARLIVDAEYSELPAPTKLAKD